MNSYLRILIWPLALTVISAALACSDDEPATNNNENDGFNQVGENTDTDADADTDTGSEPDEDVGEDAGEDTGPDADPDASSSEPYCVPGETAWQQNAEPIVQEYCAECHGATPLYGAPYPLLDYDELIAGDEGDRPVDEMLDVLMAGDMPPPASPQLGHADLDTLVAWVSCGEEHPDYGQELEASAPVWEAPDEAPSGLDHFDITAGGFDVAPDLTDEYRCFAMEVPVDDTQLMRRIEPIIDDGRVLHHFVMSVDRSQSVNVGDFGCPFFPPGDEYVYAWGPGQTALEFDDGGIRLDPDDRLVLQIHYNNGAGIEDVQDSSGLRVYYEDPAGSTEYAMGEQSTMSINVPAKDTASSSTTCTVYQEVDLVATWPHMHEIGSEFEQIVTRGDGSVDTIVELTGWHFEAQFLYHTPMTLEVGDQLTTTCTWVNPHDHNVGFGTGTADEMCFSFMYVTPAHSSFCW